MGEESGYRYDHNAIASARFVIAPADLVAPALPIERAPSPAASVDAVPPTKKIKPFIQKLAYALDHPELYGDVIRWGDDTGVFILAQQNNRLVSNLLPELFGHKNSASFVRQLGVYSFARIPSTRLASLVDTSHALALPLNSYSGWHNPAFFRGPTAELWRLRPTPTLARVVKKEEKRAEKLLLERAQQARREQNTASRRVSDPSGSTVSSHGSSVSGRSSGGRSSHGGDGYGNQYYSPTSSYSHDRSSFSPSTGSVGSGGSAGRSRGSAGRSQSGNDGFQQLQNLNLERNSISYSAPQEYSPPQPTYHDPRLPLPSFQPPPSSYNPEYRSTLPTFSSLGNPSSFYNNPSNHSQLMPEMYNPYTRVPHFPSTAPDPTNSNSHQNLNSNPRQNPNPNPYG